MPSDKKTPKEDEIPIDGNREAAALLAALDAPARERILEGIARTDPALAARLRRGMFTFAQVLALEPLDFQKALRGLPQALIALAARGLEAQSETLFFSKFSERQGRALREEREALGPRKMSEVNAAREKITEQAMKLHSAGEINLLQASKI